MKMKMMLGPLWRLLLSFAGAAVVLLLVVNAIAQPVEQKTRSYSADFTDASGLHEGADVRVRGVRVGKVDSITLQRRAGQSVAAVGFTLDTQYGITSDARLAIKFQALTGLRFVDVVDPVEKYSAADLVTTIPTSMTQPSFDVTALFNGLQPVFATLSPEQINTFTENAVTFLTGDGGGLAPVVDSIQKLAQFVTDRQQTVATLMQNLSSVAETMGGHSKDLIQILKWAERPVDAALTVLDEFRKAQLYGPEFTGEALRLLTNAGFKPGINIDDALDRAFTNLDDAIDAFKLVPPMWDNIGPPSVSGVPQQCSRGAATLPETVDILLNGQRVVLCNR